jgi:hypothetical protein
LTQTLINIPTNQCGRYKESVADDLPHFLIGFECVGKLLQSCRELFFYSENLPFPHFSTSKIQVVIPLQTKGFYNYLGGKSAYL